MTLNQTVEIDGIKYRTAPVEDENEPCFACDLPEEWCADVPFMCGTYGMILKRVEEGRNEV